MAGVVDIVDYHVVDWATFGQGEQWGKTFGQWWLKKKVKKGSRAAWIGRKEKKELLTFIP